MRSIYPYAVYKHKINRSNHWYSIPKFIVSLEDNSLENRDVP